MVFSFQVSLQIGQGLQSRALEFADPAFGDVLDRHGIDEVQLFTAVPLPGYEIGFLKNRQMLRDRLAGHVEPLAQLAERLAIPALQSIQQLPAARVGQSAKYSILIHAGNMEPLGYLTVGN